MPTTQRIAVIAILFVSFLLSSPEWGYSTTSVWWTHFSYMFAHANLLHLCCNCFSLFFLLRYQRFNLTTLFVLLIIGVVTSFITPKITPTVGVSTIVYAALGVLIFGTRSWRAWSVVVLLIASGYLSKSINANAHTVSFVLGYAYMYAKTEILTFYNDCRAIKG